MKTSRRKFLKSGAALASLAPLTSAWASQKPVNSPLVISTWNFGIGANIEAWKILSAGGRALDAVESGVHVPEGDPKINSVGLGGLPDRDGRNFLRVVFILCVGKGFNLKFSSQSDSASDNNPKINWFPRHPVKWKRE